MLRFTELRRFRLRRTLHDRQPATGAARPLRQILPWARPRAIGPSVRRTALRRLQRNRRIFSIVVGILLVLSFVVFLVTEFMQPHPFNL